MNIPVKILLINYSGYYYILKLKYVFIGDSLQIECNYYQITNTNVVSIIENTIKDNSDNEQILKSVPCSLLVNIFLSQHRGLETYYTLNHTIQANSSNFDVNQLYNIKIDTISTYLNIIQINIIKTFLEPFCNNYEQIKISLQTLITNSPKEVKVLESNEVINQPTAESSVLKPADYIEEILINLSSSKIINRFIIKCLEDNETYYEEIPTNNYITVKLTPLIKLGLTGFSILHFKNLAEIIELLDPQEAYSKLMATCKDTIAIIKDKEISDYNKSISLQILTFLIFLYGIKLGTNKMLSNNVSFEYPMNLKRHYGQSINNYFKKYILSIKDKAVDIPYIQFEFIEDSVKLIEMSNLNVSIQKYRYLLNIDKESFLQNVFNFDFKNKETKETKVSNRLLFTEPKILNIKKFIEDENSESSYLLAYKNISSKYQGHNIISEPYLHLLHIHYQSSLITLNQIKIHPVISKYCDILLNKIYKSLTSDFREMLKYTNSTLVILEKYIRPFIKDESSKIELFLLYQVLIPMIYDLDQSKTEYIDYFL
jgi:hypothetical protein